MPASDSCGRQTAKDKKEPPTMARRIDACRRPEKSRQDAAPTDQGRP
jgi:hypothetical protein